jgi:hypothetical protein
VPCSSNADCADHLTCYDGDTSDDRPSECVPQHSLACNADADCGVGFTCAPLNPCLDPSVPDCVPDAPEDGKVCFITETRACQADAECLPGWTCENNPLNAYWSNTSGQSGCNIVDPALICMPPHSPIFGHGSAGFLDWAKGVERTFTSVPESQCPEPTSPYVPYGRGGGIDERGSPDAIANDPSEPRPPAVVSDDPNDSTLPPVAPSPGDVPMAQAASGGGGCSLSIVGNHNAGQAARGLGLALLVGLAGMTVGRRRRFDEFLVEPAGDGSSKHRDESVESGADVERTCADSALCTQARKQGPCWVER